MGSTCLQVNITYKHVGLKINVSEICSIKNNHITLTRVRDPFIVKLIYNNLEISPKINRIGESLNITTEKKNHILNIGCSIICSIKPIENPIKWTFDKLQWVGDDNNEGIIKYNTLISLGKWKLEDVIIEELL